MRERPFADLSAAEIDKLIVHYRRLIHGHRWDVRCGNAEMVEHALTAIDDIKVLLRELLEVAPAEKRPKIEAILQRETV